MIDRLRRRSGLRRGQRRHWFRPWLSQAECEEEGQYTRLMPTLELNDPMAYRNFIWMPPELFQELDQRLSPEIQREKTWMRDPLSPGLKLAITLRHLASGDSYPTLQFAFRVVRSTINKFVPEVCDSIIRAYQDEVMTCPTSPEDWLEVESVFRRRWNIPHVLGALDGKHIPTRCPQWGGSLYHNYKGFHWIVLLALVEGDYKFLWVDLGATRSSSDAQIFKHSDLRHKIEDGTFSFPESESLVGDGPKVNYFILRDDAFPLKLWLMKPYSRRGMYLNHRVFNNRLSRGKRVVENAFGILTSRFRIFQRPMQQEPPMVARVVMTCLVLNNLLRMQYPTGQQEDFGADGQPPIVLEGNDIPHEGQNPLEAVKTQRNILRDYFMTDGQVPWQMD